MIHAALQLPAGERARIVARIVESLGDERGDVEAAWVAELERRVEFEGAEADFVELRDAKKQVEVELRRK